MKKTMLVALATAALATSPASAAQFTFDFVTNQVIFGGPVSGSGVFTTSDVAQQIGGRTALAIIGVSGTFNGSAITGPTLNTFGNYFISGPTFVDGSGVRFNTTTTSNVSLFFDSNAGRYRVNAINQGGSSFVTATSNAVVAAVPEPATWGLMILGFGAVGASMRRMRKASTRSVRLS